jgi:hypothetical protein
VKTLSVVVKKGERPFSLLMVAEPIGAVTGEDLIGGCEKRRMPIHAVNGG